MTAEKTEIKSLAELKKAVEEMGAPKSSNFSSEMFDATIKEVLKLIDSFKANVRERIDELILDNKRALQMSPIIREQKSVVEAMNNNDTRMEELRRLLEGEK